MREGSDGSVRVSDCSVRESDSSVREGSDGSVTEGVTVQ